MSGRIRGYAEMGFLEVWYDLIDENTILAAAPSRLRKLAEATFAKARARGHIRALDRLTEEVNGENRIVEDVPLIVRAKHLPDGRPITEALETMLRSYLASLPEDRRRLLSRYRIIDVARKVVGVGSVGTDCWVVLLEEQGAEESAVPADQGSAPIRAGATSRQHEIDQATGTARRDRTANDPGIPRHLPRLGAGQFS